MDEAADDADVNVSVSDDFRLDFSSFIFRMDLRWILSAWMVFIICLIGTSVQPSDCQDLVNGSSVTANTILVDSLAKEAVEEAKTRVDRDYDGDDFVPRPIKKKWWRRKKWWRKNGPGNRATMFAGQFK